jgi:sialic acid synthase SpsE
MALRPADGIAASDIDLVIGARMARDLAAGAALTWSHLIVTGQVSRAV